MMNESSKVVVVAVAVVAAFIGSFYRDIFGFLSSLALLVQRTQLNKSPEKASSRLIRPVFSWTFYKMALINIICIISLNFPRDCLINLHPLYRPLQKRDCRPSRLNGYPVLSATFLKSRSLVFYQIDPHKRHFSVTTKAGSSVFFYKNENARSLHLVVINNRGN